jgi:hypothetical protein
MTSKRVGVSVLEWAFSILLVTVFLFSVQANQTDEFKAESTEETTRPSAAKANSIPDLVAYELFFRTVGEGKAANFVERGGFKQDDVERIVQEAVGLHDDLKQADNSAQQIINDRNETTVNRNLLLKNIAKQKEVNISRAVNNYLSNNLSTDAQIRFRTFIEKEIKPQIQKVAGEDSYFYTTAWNEGGKVFGAGAIIGEYEVDSFYRVTVTVTSPNESRTESTQSNWRYASATHITELPISVQDGIYKIAASFEKRLDNGATGIALESKSKILGSSTANSLVAPMVNVESISPSAATLGPGENVTLVVNVSVTPDVPEGTRVVVDLTETSNPQFTYTINPASREQSFTVTEPGSLRTVNFEFNITSSTSAGSQTTVSNRARVQSVTPPQGSPAVTAGTSTATATITYFKPPPRGGGT